MSAPARRVLWLSPSPGAERAAQPVASQLGARAQVIAKDLEVWTCDLAAGYSIATEVDGAVRKAGESPVDLLGFSAGATVALAVVLRAPEVVRTVTLIEPAYIGEDAWSEQEDTYRAELARAFAAPADQHGDAFRRAVAAPHTAFETRAPPVPSPDQYARAIALERALRACGFVSADLLRISAPALVVSGARSHPRFGAQADRLCSLLPAARAVVFARRHHFSSPQRHEPEAMARVLAEFWEAGAPNHPEKPTK